MELQKEEPREHENVWAHRNTRRGSLTIALQKLGDMLGIIRIR